MLKNKAIRLPQISLDASRFLRLNCMVDLSFSTAYLNTISCNNGQW